MHWGAPAGQWCRVARRSWNLRAPADQQCKVARRSWNLRDVCVDGTTVITVILLVTFSTGCTMHWGAPAGRPVRDVFVDGTTVILSVTFRTGCTMHASAPAGQ